MEIPFSSFAAVQPNQTVVISSAISQTASGTMTQGAGGSFSIDTVAVGPLDTSAASSARLGFDGNQNLAAMSFNAPNSNVSFSGGIDCSTLVCAAENATSFAVAGNPDLLGWN